MKRALVAVIAAMPFVTLRAQAPGEVTSTFDRFDNQTLVRLRGAGIGEDLTFNAAYVMPGKLPSPPRRVLLTLVATPRSWEYLKCHTLALLVDGARIATTEPSHDGDVMTDYVIEQVAVSVSVESVRRMARAKSVEGKLCNTEFALTFMQRSALRDFVAQMDPANPAK